MNRIGIMQGRLSPIKKGVQEFPFDYWRDEFPLMKQIGFEIFEWVLDKNIDENPLLDKKYHNEIIERTCENGVEITTLCCDNFMFDSLVSEDGATREKARTLFYRLMEEICPEVGINYLELPLLNEMGLRNETVRIKYIEFLNLALKKMGNCCTTILIETDIKPNEINPFFSQLEPNKVFINYDMGNSAEMEYLSTDEIPVYGDLIKNVHVKDCTPEDYTVPLEQGNVDFERVFRLLKEIKYSGDYILQAARGKDDFKTAQSYYGFVKKFLKEY
jgi:L-ribulose-5-phosphate 3-epimerase